MSDNLEEVKEFEKKYHFNDGRKDKHIEIHFPFIINYTTDNIKADILGVINNIKEVDTVEYPIRITKYAIKFQLGSFFQSKRKEIIFEVASAIYEIVNKQDLHQTPEDIDNHYKIKYCFGVDMIDRTPRPVIL